MLTLLKQSLAYGWRRLCSRKLYIAAMVVVPVAFAFYFVDLMKEGLPLKVPVSVVDLDIRSCRGASPATSTPPS